MNILEAENIVKGMPDQQLIQQAQAPTGEFPQYLLVSEVQRRTDLRKRFSAQQPQPESTVTDQVLQEGIMALNNQQPQPPQQPGMSAGMPQPGGMPAGMPSQGPPTPQQPPAAPPMPQQGPPQQMAHGGRVMMAGGGIAPMTAGATITVPYDGMLYTISVANFPSPQAAVEAFFYGKNPPIDSRPDPADADWRNPVGETQVRLAGGEMLAPGQTASAQGTAMPELNPESASRAGIGSFDWDKMISGIGSGLSKAGDWLMEDSPAGPPALVGSGPPPEYEGVRMDPYLEKGVQWVGDKASGIAGLGAEQGWADKAAGVIRSQMLNLPSLAATTKAMEYHMEDPEEVPDPSLDAMEQITVSAEEREAILDALLSDGTAGGAEIQGAGKEKQSQSKYLKLLGEMYDTPMAEVPDYSDLIAQQQRDAYGLALGQLGAGIAAGNTASGIARATEAAYKGRRSARDMEIKQRAAEAENKNAKTNRDINILGRAAQIESYDNALSRETTRQDRMDRRSAVELAERMTKANFDNTATFYTTPEDKATAYLELFAQNLRVASARLGVQLSDEEIEAELRYQLSGGSNTRAAAGPANGSASAGMPDYSGFSIVGTRPGG